MMRDHHGEDNDDSDEDEDGEDDGGEVADYPGLPPRVHCSRRLHVGSEKRFKERRQIYIEKIKKRENGAKLKDMRKIITSQTSRVPRQQGRVRRGPEV